MPFADVTVSVKLAISEEDRAALDIIKWLRDNPGPVSIIGPSPAATAYMDKVMQDAVAKQVEKGVEAIEDKIKRRAY